MMQPRIGLALGSGAARGWAHIGVLRALEKRGIVPDIICGTSIGSIVGGFAVCDQLDALESWARNFSQRDMLRYLDVGLPKRGGMLDGRNIMEFFAKHLGDPRIEQLAKPYAAVAANLSTGNEVVFDKGPLLHAMRASMALPGVLTPQAHGDDWLIDGGVANPVPVSACRALGADYVIAVNLNARLLERGHGAARLLSFDPVGDSWLGRMSDKVREHVLGAEEMAKPAMSDVLAGTLIIMQERVLAERMHGDPPDVMLEPDLRDIALFDFDRAEEAIDRGVQAVGRAPTMPPCLE